MTPRPQERSVRIIGGKWRGRKIPFANGQSVRPTPSRIRETLFNWLQMDIAGSRTLELFGGSGVLSFEALSRGASTADIVERDRGVSAAIETRRRELGAENLAVHTADATAWIRAATDVWDIVFLDPPFADSLLEPVLHAIGPRVSTGGFVYAESPTPLAPETLPDGFELHRQKRAASVHFALLRRQVRRQVRRQ